MAPDMSTYGSPPLDPGVLPLPSFSKAFPHFYKEAESLSKDIDPFTVNSTTGFLPTQHPIKDLPHPFKCLQEICDEMPVTKADGTPGLLATHQLGPLIDSGKKLPDLTEDIDNLVVPETGKPNLHIITALFRDYSFLASAYLLEPCWKAYIENKTRSTSPQPGTQDAPTNGCPHSVTNEYGFGRPVLPAPIARPLVKLGEILNIPPFMSYAASYALYNYTLNDPTLGAEVYDNLRLIRSFEHGQDPKSSEAGFILTHIHMVAHTGPLIDSVVSTLETISKIQNNKDITTTTATQSQPQPQLIQHLKSSLSLLLSTMHQIEANMETMWSNSLPKDYTTYRTFIFGITSQPLFPNGVIYESCFNNVPQYYRGESGANDSIIPLLDNLLQIPMPKNPLTSILRDFRQYRSESQRSLLSWTESKATELGTREFFTKTGGAQGQGADAEVAVLYLRALNHVRSFRWRHWMFAREYIIKRSKYPVATGGSPIVTWLPNQLGAVLELMESVYRESGLMALISEGEFDGGGVVGKEGLSLGMADRKIVEDIMQVVEEQKVRLAKEVKKYCEERGV